MSGLAGPQVEVEEAIVVEVGEIASHRGEDQVEAGVLGHVLESLALEVAEEPVGSPPVRLADDALDHVAERSVVTGGEDVEPAVVVVVPGPAREALLRPVDAHGLGHVGECPVAVVVVEPRGPDR